MTIYRIKWITTMHYSALKQFLKSSQNFLNELVCQIWNSWTEPVFTIASRFSDIWVNFVKSLVQKYSCFQIQYFAICIPGLHVTFINLGSNTIRLHHLLQLATFVSKRWHPVLLTTSHRGVWVALWQHLIGLYHLWHSVDPVPPRQFLGIAGVWTNSGRASPFLQLTDKVPSREEGSR